MNVITFFTEYGVPKTGLSPSIDIWEIDGTQVVTTASMFSIGGGFYYYPFSGYDNSKDYCFRADGGSVLNDNERYTISSNFNGVIETQIDGLDLPVDINAIADAVWDESALDHTTPDTMGDKLNTASSGGVDYGALADAIWNDNIVNRVAANSAGLALYKLLSAEDNDAQIVDNGDGTKTVTIWTAAGEPNISRQFLVSVVGNVETRVGL